MWEATTGYNVVLCGARGNVTVTVETKENLVDEIKKFARREGLTHFKVYNEAGTELGAEDLTPTVGKVKIVAYNKAA